MNPSEEPLRTILFSNYRYQINQLLIYSEDNKTINHFKCMLWRNLNSKKVPPVVLLQCFALSQCYRPLFQV